MQGFWGHPSDLHLPIRDNRETRLDRCPPVRHCVRLAAQGFDHDKIIRMPCPFLTFFKAFYLPRLQLHLVFHHADFIPPLESPRLFAFRDHLPWSYLYQLFMGPKPSPDRVFLVYFSRPASVFCSTPYLFSPASQFSFVVWLYIIQAPKEQPTGRAYSTPRRPFFF